MPTLAVGFNDLAVLKSVILGYLAYARRAIPPTQQRKVQMLLLEGVYRRLSAVPLDIKETRILLQEPEIYALNVAIMTFAAFVQKKVPPSSERDMTLYSLENLRQALVQMLSTS